MPIHWPQTGWTVNWDMIEWSGMVKEAGISSHVTNGVRKHLECE